MIPVIEKAGSSDYPERMRLLALRLLALVVVMLMPFGMSAAPAASLHQEQMGMVPMQHCPEPSQAPAGKGALADCTMACAAALPAMDLASAEMPLLLPPPIEEAVIATLSGIELEIATPPPRLT